MLCIETFLFIWISDLLLDLNPWSFCNPYSHLLWLPWPTASCFPYLLREILLHHDFSSVVSDNLLDSWDYSSALPLISSVLGNCCLLTRHQTSSLYMSCHLKPSPMAFQGLLLCTWLSGFLLTWIPLWLLVACQALLPVELCNVCQVERGFFLVLVSFLFVCFLFVFFPLNFKWVFSEISLASLFSKHHTEIFCTPGKSFQSQKAKGIWKQLLKQEIPMNLHLLCVIECSSEVSKYRKPGSKKRKTNIACLQAS